MENKRIKIHHITELVETQLTEKSNQMIVIRYTEIPTYLQVGDFYRNLDSNDMDSQIEVPANCFNEQCEVVSDLNAFILLIRVTVFWMLDDIPTGIFDYCMEHNVDDWKDAVISVPGANEIQSLLLAVHSKRGDLLFQSVVETNQWNIIVHVAKKMNKSKGIATAVAAELGNVRLLEHLREEDFFWNAQTCARASAAGQLRCLQYLHDYDCPWDGDVYVHAARNGHLNCIQYAFLQGLEWDEQTCENAAYSGHLQCLQFAREHGCPWNNETTYFATQSGHVNCLQYALSHGCPVDIRSTNIAGKYCDFACFELLHQYDAPWNEETAYYACTSMACLQYLRENGCPWDERTTERLATEGLVEQLTYAVEHGCPCPSNIVEFCAYSGNLVCLRYLVEDQLKLLNKEAFIVALLKGDLMCLQYLVDQGCPHLDAHFGDNIESIFSDYALVPLISEVSVCIQYAIERSWVPDQRFIENTVTRSESCKNFFLREQSVTEEDVRKYYREVHRDNMPKMDFDTTLPSLNLWNATDTK